MPGTRPGHNAIWERTTGALQGGQPAEQAMAADMLRHLGVENQRSRFYPPNIFARGVHGTPKRRVLLGRGMASGNQPMVPPPANAPM